MERTVLKYAPSYWNTSYEDDRQFELRESADEYIQIKNEIKQATRDNYIGIRSIKRNQNIHDFGQVLMREQLLAVVNPYKNYFRVRRYITIKSQYLNTALEYNLDHRRCGKASLTFQKRVNPGYNELILVVQVIVNSTEEDYITPGNSSDYFIDYIVTMNN